MRNLAYACTEYKPFFICDAAAKECYESGIRKCDWTDRELRVIRRVLQKLATLRIMNPNDAEDLVQDTMLTMITKLPEIDLEKGLLVWGMGILRKKVGNYYRKAQRYTSLDAQGTYDQEWPYNMKSEATPEGKVRYEELRTLVETIVSRFPPLQRQAIEFLMTGLKANEIVSQMQPVRYQNVINRLHRGRKKLAKELAKHGYGLSPRAGVGQTKCGDRKR